MLKRNLKNITNWPRKRMFYLKPHWVNYSNEYKVARGLLFVSYQCSCTKLLKLQIIFSIPKHTFN